MNKAVRALVGLHLSRLWKPTLTLVGASLAMVALNSIRHPLTVDNVLPWLLIVGIGSPTSVAMAVGREKMDGTFRYYASLPVTAAEHALARACAVVLLALPLGIVVAIIMAGPMVGLPALFAGVAGLGAVALITTMSLVLLATTIMFHPGQAMSYISFAFMGVFALFTVSDYLGIHGAGAFFIRLLKTPSGLAMLSATLWVMMGAVAFVAFRIIGSKTVSYRGEQFLQLR